MKETTSAAMPPCFDRWCQKFDDLFQNKSQKREFRNYLAGLLGESERKNLSQIARDAVEVTYHRLHHFLTEAPWSSDLINERRLQIMNKCNQTKICSGFSLIVLEIEISKLKGSKKIAIVMNNAVFSEASDID